MATRASRIALAGSNISSTGEVDADLLDNTDSAAFLSLDSNGRLGIGTSDPLAPLHVNGNIVVGSGDNNQKIYMEGAVDDLNMIHRSTTENAMIMTSRHAMALIIDSNNDDGDTGTGSFSIRRNGTTIAGSASCLEVIPNGNVGIGTTTPDVKFHVSGGNARVAGTETSGSFMDINPSNTGSDGVSLVASYYGSGSYGPLKLYTGGQQRMHIESGGDIVLGDPAGFGNASKTRIHSQYGGIQYDALQIRNETATVQGRGAGISFWGGSNASRIAGVVASTSDTNDLTKGKLSLYATDYVNIDSTSAIRIARGTNSERPTSPSAGMIRFNTTSSSYEGWTGTEWTILSNTSSIVNSGLLANFQPNNISDGSTSWNDSTGNYTFSQLNSGTGSIVKDGAYSWYGSAGSPGFKSSSGVSALNFGTGNFTVECWVYFSTTAYGTWKYILGKSTFWEVNSYGFYISSDGSKVGFHWTSGNGTEVNLSGLGVGWHHLAAVGSGGNSIKFYIDGNLEASATPSYNLTTTSQISFNGDEAAYHLTSNDRLGSARWYNIALTSAQVNQNRNAEIARY